MAQNPDGFVVVTAPTGKVRGILQTSSQGDLYYSFKGIPYAKPPVASLRFRDPEPIEPWPGVRDALAFGPKCAQYDSTSKTVKGSDDCLYLNVYTKYLGDLRPKAVMVWLHGGAFIYGSGDDMLYGPDYLLTEDIVLVTINYRLGVFGFLNLEDAEAPGNLGFKDQVMALKWVQTHIHRFGGNPDNVTVFGESAGSASVHYLTLSPLVKGLFHRAICQSGCVLNPWSTMHKPKEMAYKFLDLLNCNETNSKDIVEYLRKVKTEHLVEAQEKLMTPQTWIQTVFPFGPGVDNKSSNPFMPIPVSEAAKQGIQVPLIIGYTNNEGIFSLKFLEAISSPDFNFDLDQFISPNISEILKYYNLTLDDLKQIYFGSEKNSKKNSKKNIEELVEFWGDIVFVEGIERTLAIQSDVSGSPTYFYKFSYDKNITPFKSADIVLEGATHGDEMAYLFSATPMYEPLQVKQLQDGTGADTVMKIMVDLWARFAKHGIPTPTITGIVPLYWKPINSHENLRYLHIGEELRMETSLNIRERYLLKKKTIQST